MKTIATQTSSAVPSPEQKPDSSKLISLLALATGAVAMPQSSSADIIFSDQGGTIAWEGNRSFIIDLPGNVDLGFQAHRQGVYSFTSMRSATMAKQGAGYLRFRMALLSEGVLWDQIPGTIPAGSAAIMATAQSTIRNPGSFSQLYVAFRFRDSTQPGTPMRYGWVDLTLDNGYLNSGWDYPALTISRWAWDNTGAQLATGRVPEPSSMSLLALGALALGAKGIRAWRRNRPSAK